MTAPVEADDFQGSHAVVLGKTVQATVSHLDASEVVQNLDLTLDAGKRMVLHDDALARFGVLREWRANENGQDRRVRLMVVQGKTEGTADLCWRVETPQVHRTSCSVWHIPRAGNAVSRCNCRTSTWKTPACTIRMNPACATGRPCPPMACRYRPMPVRRLARARTAQQLPSDPGLCGLNAAGRKCHPGGPQAGRVAGSGMRIMHP